MDSDDSDFSDVIIKKSKQNGGGGGNKRLSVERIYQKKTQLEHILLRPDTYIGSVETVTQEMWVYDGEEQGLVHRNVTYVPGLYKIFDEILVNAADNKQRDKNMDTIKIEINPESNMISVYNNGKGIPIVEHKDEKMYVPSLIFGHLLTSSNYNDEEKKVTGGRNGYGAKLCNIFSNKFIVETSSRSEKKCFKQIWTDNMTKTSDAKITTSSSDDYTKITFHPDLQKFGMSSLDKDIVALLSRRAYDVAGSTKGVKVFLNGRRVPVKNFKDYIELYLNNKENEETTKFCHEIVSDRWEIAIATSEKGFQSVSFVNSIATTKGGRHVDYIGDQVVSKLAEIIKKKNKDGIVIKPHTIKSYLFVFVNCLIENPTFDSQTKENMTLQAKNFGSKCNPSDKFFNLAVKLGVVDMVLNWAKFKAESKLDKKCSGKKTSKIKNIPKLEDANDAGRKDSINCTLILTEGDSAKSLVVAGLGVIGRDRYGVFPLRGKILNVREASSKQIMDNAEINNIIKIVGLQYKKVYKTIDDLKSLRYGKLMIMTDQDQDGSHIKGLLINFFHSNWPDLLKLPFLEQFITPIVKVSKGNISHSFYSLPELDEWKKNTRDHDKWKVKYYKGLGTSTSQEAKEYFTNIQRHRITFKYSGPEDDHSVLLAFSKKMCEQRKDWLTNNLEDRKRRKEIGLPEQYLYEKDTRQVSYKDFVNKELVLFSNLDNERSIPSAMDGLKPGQRKVLFTCFKRNDKREVKVAQLAGSVGEMSAYHHGEASLMSTIIGLAQDFVGSNNINLLLPLGQFGTRLNGGKDAASPRYIFTMLNPLTRKLFPALDEPLLNYLYDDNLKVEPDYYLPILPMVLVNGAEGIGTGWSTKVPNYNPRDLVANIKRLLRKEELVPMNPWFKGFKGKIEKFETHRYVVTGQLSLLDNNDLDISELPLKTWTQAYKENVLEPMLNGTDKTPSFITDYREYHTDTSVRFILSLSEQNLHKAQSQGIYKTFKLLTTFSTASMILFDKSGCIKKYESPEEVLREFFDVRYEFYQKRKDYMIGMLEAEALKLINQARFITEKIEGRIKIENVKKKDFIKLLIDRKYDSDPVKAWRRKNGFSNEKKRKSGDEEGSEEEEEPDEAFDYDYLFDMKIRTMLKEKVEELLKKRDSKKEELESLRSKSIEQLWETDLDNFIEELEKSEQQELANASKLKSMNKSSKSAKGKARAVNNMDSYIEKNPGEKLEPVKEIDILKKDANKTSRAKKVKKEVESFEDEDIPLSNRIGTSPQMIDEKKGKSTKGLKQTTLNFKPLTKNKEPKEKSPKKKTKKRKDSESEESDFEVSGDDFSESEIIKPAITKSNRAASKKVVFNFEESEEENSIKEVENENKIPEKSNPPQTLTIDSDDDDLLPFKPVEKSQKRSSEELFDAFIKGAGNDKETNGISNGKNGDEYENKNHFDDDDDDDIVPIPLAKKQKVTKVKETKPKAPKEPKEQKKRAPAKTKKTNTESGDGDSPKKTKKPSKKRVFSSDEEDFIPLGEKLEDVRAANRPGRQRAQVNYALDSDEQDD